MNMDIPIRNMIRKSNVSMNANQSIMMKSKIIGLIPIINLKPKSFVNPLHYYNN